MVGMPTIMEARARTLSVHFQLLDHSEEAVQQLVESAGEGDEVFPYGVNVRVEVDGQPIGLIDTMEVNVEAGAEQSQWPLARFRLPPADIGGADLRQSIERAFERLTAFPFVQVDTFDDRSEEVAPKVEVAPEEEPARPTIWERLMADD